jgi:hypothetical protein
VYNIKTGNESDRIKGFRLWPKPGSDYIDYRGEKYPDDYGKQQEED